MSFENGIIIIKPICEVVCMMSFHANATF